MKKILSLALALALVLSLCACGGNSNTETSPTAPESTAPTKATEATTEAPTEAQPEETKFFAGFGRTDITPQESVPMGGYGNTSNRLSTGYLDPLKANCIALQDGNGETIIHCVLDIISISDAVMDSVRRSINATTGVAADHIFVEGTHTHSGPDMGSTLPSIARYKSYMCTQAGEAAALAMADLKPCTASAGTAEINGMNFVRHYLLSNGTYAGDNFGDFSSGSIVGHETEADHTLRALRFEREGAKDILLVNFQVHSTTTGGILKTNLSSCIVGQIRENLEKIEDCYCSYMQGAAGNINPKSNISGEYVGKNVSDHREYGQLFAEQASAGLAATMTPIALGPIKLTGDITYTGRVNHTQDSLLAKAVEINTIFTTTGDRARCSREGAPYGIHSCYHASAIISKSKLPETLDINISAISFGEVGIFTASYEMFDGNANFVREHSPFALTLCMGYCNGSNSYIASDYAYDHTCYEADQCRFEKGTAEALADKYVELLTGLKNAADPTEKVEIKVPEQKKDNSLEGLTCDGKVYCNYAYTYYQGDVTRPRKLSDAGSVYTLTVVNPEGKIEEFTVKGKTILLKADTMNYFCIWKDAQGEIAAFTAPEAAGITIYRGNYVSANDNGKVTLNTGHDLDGRETVLTIPASTAIAMVPTDPKSTEQPKQANVLLSQDQVTVCADKDGKITALYLLSRMNSEGRNLALDSTVSCTYAPYTYMAENLIDGNHKPDVTTSCRYHWDENGYFLFELDDVHHITGYRIYNYEWPYQWCINEAWTVYGSLDGENWTKLAEDGIDCSGFTSSVKYASEKRNGEPDGGEFAEPMDARYVKLVIDKVFVGEGTAANTDPAACQVVDVRMYEVEIWGE